MFILRACENIEPSSRVSLAIGRPWAMGPERPNGCGTVTMSKYTPISCRAGDDWGGSSIRFQSGNAGYEAESICSIFVIFESNEATVWVSVWAWFSNLDTLCMCEHGNRSRCCEMDLELGKTFGKYSFEISSLYMWDDLPLLQGQEENRQENPNSKRRLVPEKPVHLFRHSQVTWKNLETTSARERAKHCARSITKWLLSQSSYRGNTEALSSHWTWSADVTWVQNKSEPLACQSGHKWESAEATVKERKCKTEQRTIRNSILDDRYKNPWKPSEYSYAQRGTHKAAW